MYVSEVIIFHELHTQLLSTLLSNFYMTGTLRIHSSAATGKLPTHVCTQGEKVSVFHRQKLIEKTRSYNQEYIVKFL